MHQPSRIGASSAEIFVALETRAWAFRPDSYTDISSVCQYAKPGRPGPAGPTYGSPVPSGRGYSDPHLSQAPSGAAEGGFTVLIRLQKNFEQEQGTGFLMLATGASPWNSALIRNRALEEGDSCTTDNACENESPSARALYHGVHDTTGLRPWLT